MMIPPVLLSLDYYSDFDPQSAGSIAKLNRQMWLSLERTWSQVILLLKQRSIYKSIIPSHGSNPVTRDGWIRFLRKTLLSFSDQQLATGIGIQVAGWAQVCDMSFHHWATVYALASISHQTHFLTVLNLRPYFQANRRLSKIRISCMLINALLLISYGVIVSLGNAAVDIDSMSYVYCVFHLHRHNDDFGKNLSIKSVVFGVWALIGIVFTLLSAAFYLLKGRWSSFTLGCAIGAVVPTVVLVGETLSSQQALGTYRWMDGDDERNMSFGQILPLLLLFLPILTALEEFEGEFVDSFYSAHSMLNTRQKLGRLRLRTTTMIKTTSMGIRCSCYR